MYFESFVDLVAMGGHGLYVWLAYGVTVVALVYLLLAPIVLQATQLKRIASASRQQQARKQTVQGD